MRLKILGHYGPQKTVSKHLNQLARIIYLIWFYQQPGGHTRQQYKEIYFFKKKMFGNIRILIKFNLLVIFIVIIYSTKYLVSDWSMTNAKNRL